MMTRLQRLQQERNLISETLREIDRKIIDERLTIALKTMGDDPELMKALHINTKGG